MVFDNLLLEREGAVAIVTINRPKVLNALNARTLDELGRAVLDLKHDDGVRVVIVTGAGEKSFVAGAGSSELAVQTATGGAGPADTRPHTLEAHGDLGEPVNAAVHSPALGR